MAYLRQDENKFKILYIEICLCNNKLIFWHYNPSSLGLELGGADWTLYAVARSATAGLASVIALS